MLIHLSRFLYLKKFDSFEYEFKDFEIFPNDKFKQKYDSVVIPDEEHINIIVSTTITNVCAEPKDILLEQFILETDLWSSNIGLYTFMSLNQSINSTSITINPGEDIHLILPFNYIRLYDEEFSYELVSKKNISLCFYMNYPQKAIVKLNNK